MANRREQLSFEQKKQAESLINELFRQHRIYNNQLIEIAENLTRNTPHIERASQYELMSVHLMNMKKAEEILSKGQVAHQHEERMDLC
jgi:hypothetical protein